MGLHWCMRQHTHTHTHTHTQTHTHTHTQSIYIYIYIYINKQKQKNFYEDQRFSLTINSNRIYLLTQIRIQKIEYILSGVYIHECTYKFTCALLRHAHSYKYKEHLLKYTKNICRKPRSSRIVNSNRKFTDTNPGIKKDHIKSKQSLINK